MKHTFLFAVAALFISAAVFAQTTPTTTLDSIRAKYHLQTMPAPLTMEKTFPVLGTYQLTNSSDSASTISISLDADNKGMIWVEGLPEGKMKAYLKKSPSTYRILSQKSESGKQIPEGTLVFDSTANTLNIALGKAFDDADPNAVFMLNTISSNTAEDQEVKVKTKTATSKTKTKAVVKFYTATKNVPLADPNMNETMPQQDSTDTQDSGAATQEEENPNPQPEPQQPQQ